MKFKNEEILQILNSFSLLEKKEKEGGEKSLVLPASVSWKRRLNKRALLQVSEEINSAMEEIKAEYRDEKYSIPDPKNKDIRRIKAKYQEEFLKKQDDILEQETEIEIRSVKLSELPEELTDIQMDTLEFMIEGE